MKQICQNVATSINLSSHVKNSSQSYSSTGFHHGFKPTAGLHVAPFMPLLSPWHPLLMFSPESNRVRCTETSARSSSQAEVPDAALVYKYALTLRSLVCACGRVCLSLFPHFSSFISLQSELHLWLGNSSHCLGLLSLPIVTVCSCGLQRSRVRFYQEKWNYSIPFKTWQQWESSV